MTVPTVRFDALLLPGVERAAGHARRWLRDILDGHPCLDDASLCLSELVTNALRYTDSGRGGQILVEVSHSDLSVRIEVVDDGGAATVPHLAVPGETAIGGRGLRIVAFLSSGWGVVRRAKGHAVWFEIGRG
ncbi:ATP-binding protein [Actinomadura madurae]|uniref:ATP-binding protein n=1 Tax=Actinomadura madurae TaxID=1993 RepID=UPI002026CADE|nr:ATP-binding protein [Actinomadura madurae]MCP9955176.1 ATP-binding protein [Actinomadura madurae]MCP9971910.1 ATP-binding protein [Actinomadura madurae]MCP9984415.1 ATP-binding protein [Actinomadura madurae]MCQ0004034.1 ATP-binding protein [Actinomadura madurae]MCQ0020608.1 ATP-binding protein [Actinomadura madurae]